MEEPLGVIISSSFVQRMLRDSVLQIHHEIVLQIHYEISWIVSQVNTQLQQPCGFLQGF